MKKFISVLALLCVLGAFLCFGGCDNVENSQMSVSVKVALPTAVFDYSVSGEFATVEDVLNALKEGDNSFTYEASQTEHGSFLTSVCGYAASGNEFWGIYTDTVRKDSFGLLNVLEEFTFNVGETVYYSCASGISTQAVGDGETIVLAVSTFD